MNATPVSFVLASLVAVLAAAASPAARAADPLPVLHAAPARTSVSGLSSGAFMAVQYGVAFSSSVAGIGVVAGGPYNCAGIHLGIVGPCMSGAPSGAASWLAAQGFASFGQIDPVANLAKMKVYVFSGTQDNVVRIYGTGGWLLVPSPWVINRDGGASKLLLHRPGAAAPEEIVIEAAPLYALEADAFAAAVRAGLRDVPSMTTDDGSASPRRRALTGADQQASGTPRTSTTAH